MIGEPKPLMDIRTAEDTEVAADHITDHVRKLTRDQDSALYVSIPGSRKTPGLCTGSALSLYSRRQDRLSHVLVSAPYESLPDSFYLRRAGGA